MKKLMYAAVLISLTSGICSAGNNYRATNCELFIDKIAAVTGSHGYKGLNIWVKTLNTRLDGEIAEVGFQNLSNTISWKWQDLPLTSHFGSADYFTITLPITTMWMTESAIYEGTFYLRTKNWSTYWIKNIYGNDFVFDLNAFDILEKKTGFINYSGTTDSGVPTQRGDMTYYNPGVCY